MKASVRVLFSGFLLSACLPVAGEEASKLPYNVVNRTMLLLKTSEIDGKNCVPFYKRAKEGHPRLDPEKANIRIRTWDGEEIPLKCVPIGELTEAQRPSQHDKMIEDGYTHVLWLPKGEKAFMDGHLVHSLPKGALEMVQCIHFRGGTKSE